jgi:hypothetical protein
MPQEKARVIIEVSGGVVTVYASSFVEAIIVDHDDAMTRKAIIQPFREFDRPETYDGDDCLRGWGV